LYSTHSRTQYQGFFHKKSANIENQNRQAEKRGSLKTKNTQAAVIRLNTPYGSISFLKGTA